MHGSKERKAFRSIIFDSSAESRVNDNNITTTKPFVI